MCHAGLQCSNSAGDAKGAEDVAIPGVDGGVSCATSLAFQNGSTENLAFGPDNRILAGLFNAPEVVKNYEGDIVFMPPTLKAPAQVPDDSTAPPLRPTVRRSARGWDLKISIPTAETPL